MTPAMHKGKTELYTLHEAECVLLCLGFPCRKRVLPGASEILGGPCSSAEDDVGGGAGGRGFPPGRGIHNFH